MYIVKIPPKKFMSDPKTPASEAPITGETPNRALMRALGYISERYRGVAMPSNLSISNSDLLAFGAHYNDRELCDLAVKWGKLSEEKMDFDAMLTIASKNNRAMCVYAIELGATDVGEMLSNGICYHRPEICRLAIDWYGCSKNKPEIKIDYNIVLMNATLHNRIDMCKFLKDNFSEDKRFGKTTLNWNGMLMIAAESGNHELCYLAKKWGEEFGTKMDWNRMLKAATDAGLLATCALAKEYGATNYYEMLMIATKFSEVDLCYLAGEWMCTAGEEADWNDMLMTATKYGQRAMCCLAKKWILSSGTEVNHQNMLLVATKYGHQDMCELAKDWNDSYILSYSVRNIMKSSKLDLDKMLTIATKWGHRKLCYLANKWASSEKVIQGVSKTKKMSCEELCVFPKNWSKPKMNWNHMLATATKWGRLDLCELAKEWGATYTD
jgi:hypothetical protein